MTALWLMGAAALALLLRHFVCVLALVQGKSMRDSLRGGELLFALRRGPAGRIRRFDVVLCRYPGRKELFVKRVAALPGERVAIEEGALLIDGASVEENFALRPSRCNLSERALGADEYFVLGDNRPCSRDSRSVGPIPDEAIVAVAACVLFPPRGIRRLRPARD